MAKRGPTTRTVAERLAQYSKLDPLTGCINFIGSRHRYGTMWDPLYQKVRKAHRIAWELVHGPVPEKFCVLHKCDNPPCINVDHLFLGTQQDNLADMNAKGRRRNPWSKTANNRRDPGIS